MNRRQEGWPKPPPHGLYRQGITGSRPSLRSSPAGRPSPRATNPRAGGPRAGGSRAGGSRSGGLRAGSTQAGGRPRPSRRPAESALVYRRRRLGAGGLALGLLCALIVLVDHGGRATTKAVTRTHSSHPSVPPAETAVDPSRFAPTACEAFAPTAGTRHLTVFLDAGHGGLDPGATGETESGSTIYEADETLPVELDATALLRAAGFRVVDSRTGDTNVARLGPADVDGGVLTDQGVHDDVSARAICANEAGADLLVGIYFDSGASPSNAGSVTGYDAARSFSTANLRFANLLQADVLAAMNAQGWQIPNEGVLPDGDLGSATSQAAIDYGHLLLLGPADPGWFDTPSQMPGALIEPLFITDPFEGSIAASTKGQEVIAQGIADAVESYFAPPPATAPATAG
jgi:N-acetylmuramoyl-L-alanine amidase